MNNGKEEPIIVEKLENAKSISRFEHYKRLGLKIAYYRKYRNMTQLNLAEEVGISRTYMSNIEAPRTMVNPTMDVIFDIADALDISIGQLFDDA